MFQVTLQAAKGKPKKTYVLQKPPYPVKGETVYMDGVPMVVIAKKPLDPEKTFFVSFPIVKGKRRTCLKKSQQIN